MIRECFKANVGILFHRNLFINIGMDPAKLDSNAHERPDIVYSPVASTQPSDLSPANQDPAKIGGNFVSEEHEEAADAVSETHDQLKEAWWWWILEYTPQPVYYKDDADADVMVQK